MLAEQRFRRLDALEKLAAVYYGFAVGEQYEEAGVKREAELAVA
jgi:hypothetical protein